MASTVILLEIVCFYVFLKQMKKKIKKFSCFPEGLEEFGNEELHTNIQENR